MRQLNTLNIIRVNILLILILLGQTLQAQTQFVNTNPFPLHYFIENKGQFNSNSEFSAAPDFELNLLLTFNLLILFICNHYVLKILSKYYPICLIISYLSFYLFLGNSIKLILLFCLVLVCSLVLFISYITFFDGTFKLNPLVLIIIIPYLYLFI